MRPRIALGRAVLAGALVAVLLGPGAEAANASRSALYGVQDDAWIAHGPGTLEARARELDRMGVDVVRYTVRWDVVARARPSVASDPEDPVYDWREPDAVLGALRRHGIQPVVTLLGTPRWANGGRSSNWAPSDTRSFGRFAGAAASRYRWVRYWTVWNEPNRPQWLRPTSARTYVQRLLNPAYAQIRAASPHARVGGGVTAPRGGTNGVSPVRWIAEMGSLHARLDAYAHHPYPGRPQAESPWGPACARCTSITMADLERLVRLVRRTFGPKRIWLTEYGYQTNPPDRFFGVAPDVQASYVASAMRRVYTAASVDLLVFFMVRDDSVDSGWQSGFFDPEGAAKPAYTALRFPLRRVDRTGDSVVLWGQVRPRRGPQPYRIRMLWRGRTTWLGGVRRTDATGTLSISVRAPAGAVLQLYSVRDREYGLELRV